MGKIIKSKKKDVTSNSLDSLLGLERVCGTPIVVTLLIQEGKVFFIDATRKKLHEVQRFNPETFDDEEEVTGSFPKSSNLNDSLLKNFKRVDYFG